MGVTGSTGWLQRLRERGVIRVAVSYAVIAWLLLQIADVTFEPLGVPRWVMVSLIVTAILGFPVAVALAWFYETGDGGVTRDTAAEGVPRPVVHGLRRYADVAIIGVLLAAVAVLRTEHEIRDLGRPEHWYRNDYALALALNGNREASIAALQRYANAGAYPFTHWQMYFELEPALAAMREDQRFREPAAIHS